MSECVGMVWGEMLLVRAGYPETQGRKYRDNMVFICHGFRYVPKEKVVVEDVLI